MFIMHNKHLNTVVTQPRLLIHKIQLHLKRNISGLTILYIKKITMKLLRLNILIFFIIIFCFSCEDYYNKRVVFTLQSINVDKSVVGRGESVNISANITVQGQVNENNVKYTWDCTNGEFNDPTKQATIWTAPSDNTGEFLIRLKVSLGNTEED